MKKNPKMQLPLWAAAVLAVCDDEKKIILAVLDGSELNRSKIGECAQPTRMLELEKIRLIQKKDKKYTLNKSNYQLIQSFFDDYDIEPSRCHGRHKRTEDNHPLLMAAKMLRLCETERIIGVLSDSEGGEMTVNRISRAMNELDVYATSEISNILNRLRMAGIVKCVSISVNILYSLNKENLAILAEFSKKYPSK